MEQNLIEQLIKIVRDNIKHVDYERVCELAKQYKSIITNKDTDGFFKQIIKREDNEWYEQRQRLTNLILMPLAKMVITPTSRVARSNDFRREITFSDDKNGVKEIAFQEIIACYYGTKSLDWYLRNRFMRIAELDPNAWHVTDWDTVEKPTTENVIPFPIVHYAHEAIMFQYDRNELQYLCAELQQEEKKKMNKFLMYGKTQTIVAVQIEQKDYPILEMDYNSEIYREFDGVKYFVTKNKKYYKIIENQPHKLNRVPAKRFGYIYDDYTDFRTYVNTFHHGLPYFLDSVKAKSEKDLTFALHTFPIRLQYDTPCPHCHKGVTIEGKVCEKCNGTGTLISTSAQETITLPMPRDKESFIPLGDLLTYVRPPTDIIDIMLRNLDIIENKVWQAVWGQETISRQEITEAVTATEKIISEQAKNDKLYPLAEHLCEVWTFVANVIADVTSMKTKESAIYMTIGKEFSLKTKHELMSDYKIQKENGMSYDIFSKTERELIKLEFSNEPNFIKKFDIRQRFKPFSDKTPEQLNIILSQNNTTKEDKVLWTNYDTIWDALELEHEDIYEKNPNEIRKLLDIKVLEIIEKTQPEITTPFNFNFGNNEQ